MDFDFTTETITPDTTNVLTIAGTGGLEVPIGITGERPGTPLNGIIRYNSTLNQIEGYLNNKWDNLVPTPANVVIVQKTPLIGQFSSVADAITSITDASATKRYLISVMPGDYTEPPFSLKSYVYIKGTDAWGGVNLITNDNNNHFITAVGNAGLENVAITGPTGVGFAAIDHSASGVSKLYWLNIKSGYYGVWAHGASVGTTSRVHAIGVVSEASGAATPTRLFYATDYSNIMMMQAGPMVGSWSGKYGVYADGANASVTLDLCQFRTAAGTSIYCDNNALVRGISCSFATGSVAMYAGPNGGRIDMHGSQIKAGGYTTEIRIDNPSVGNFTYSGNADRTKFLIAAGAPISMSFSDDNVGTEGQVIYGELWIGNESTSTPLTTYVDAIKNTGVTSGSGIRFKSGPPSLDVTVPAGTAFIATPTGLKYVAWAEQDITLPASTERVWIYMQSSGAAAWATSEPDTTQYAELGEAATNGSRIIFLTNYSPSMAQFIPAFDEYLGSVVGPISVSGCATTKPTPPSLQLNVDSGSFYVEFNLHNVTATSPITFVYWYRNGSGGWTTVLSQTAIDSANYDDGSGTLAAVPAGKFKRDLLYVAGLNGDPLYHVVYGQALFDTAILAIDNPAAPDILTNDSCRLAGIVAESGATDISTIYDQRPKLGQLASGTTTVTVHGNLSGLSANDHPQYQLVSEKNVASGYCGLDAGGLVPIARLPITNTPPVDVNATVAAVGTSTEYARADHKHSVTTAIVSTIGTANSAGASTSLARADHIHAHGSQTDGTLHAIVTTSVPGFMSAADKTKLDGIATGAQTGTVTSIAATQPAAGLTITGSPVTTSGTFVFALADDLLAVEGLSTAGLATRTASNTWTTRTATGTTNRISITDGDGVAGNPTIDISSAYVGQASITTLGTITTGTWNGTTISVARGGTGLTAIPTNGQLLIGNGTGYTLSTLIGIAGNITVTNGAGSSTLDLATVGTAGTYASVTTDAFGRVTTGTATQSIATGGTGLTALGTANQIIGVNAGATALEYKTLIAGSNITITPAAGSLTIAATAPAATPAGVTTNVQFNNAGAFGGTNNFNYVAGANPQVNILGTTATTQLVVGSVTPLNTDIVTGSNNATLYLEVPTDSVAEGLRVYFKRSTAGISGWITYDYDAAAPNIRLTDEDDDPPYIQFNTIGTGTYALPQYLSYFGARGAAAARTTGFEWKIGTNTANWSAATTIMTVDSQFLSLPSGTTVQRPATPTAGMSRFNTTLSKMEYYTGAAWVPSGTVIQTVSGTIARASSNVQIPFDATIPLSTEGLQLWTQSFTPLLANSTIYITTNSFFVINSANDVMVSGATFSGTTCINAQGLGFGTTVGAGNAYSTVATETSGSTAARTYSFRAGPNSSVTVFYGQGVTATFGGTVATGRYIITEIAP